MRLLTAACNKKNSTLLHVLSTVLKKLFLIRVEDAEDDNEFEMDADNTEWFEDSKESDNE